MTSKVKNIIIGAVVLVIVVFLYMSFSDKDSSSDPELLSSGNVEDYTVTPPAEQTSGIGSDFLTILLNVQSIVLDTSLFANPAFTSLHDSSILLEPDGTEGRPNPFAPIGFDTTSTSVAPQPSNATSTGGTPKAKTTPTGGKGATPLN